jgi:hypothetical protein
VHKPAERLAGSSLPSSNAASMVEPSKTLKI